MNTFRQTAVGVFVLLGLICVGYLTVKLGKMEVITDKGFELSATFNSVSGLRVGADVELAGVPVGRVTNIVLTDDMRARVSLRLDRPLQLTDDTIASVKTSGLIGDKYISLSPGGLRIWNPSSPNTRTAASSRSPETSPVALPKALRDGPRRQPSPDPQKKEHP